MGLEVIGPAATAFCLLLLQTTIRPVVSFYHHYHHYGVPPLMPITKKLPARRGDSCNDNNNNRRIRGSPRFASSSSTFNPDSVEAKLRSLGVTTKIELLSADPLLFVVPSFLSPQECRAYRNYTSSFSNNTTTTTTTNTTTQRRHMTRSNPPEVTLTPAKLWPLPLLALLSGLPPLVRLLETTTPREQEVIMVVTPAAVLAAVLPNVMVAAAAMAALAWLVVLPLIRNVSDQSSRTSVACALNQVEDLPMIEALVQRACVVAGHDPHRWEAPVVTRYDPGARFARHGDASPTGGSEWRDIGGQRIVTCICYLNTLAPGRGGETYFDRLDIAVRPITGSALFFFPADATTWRADERTTHESLPVRSSTGSHDDDDDDNEKEKWIVQLFGRAALVPPPLGLPLLSMTTMVDPSATSKTAVTTTTTTSATSYSVPRPLPPRQ